MRGLTEPKLSTIVMRTVDSLTWNYVQCIVCLVNSKLILGTFLQGTSNASPERIFSRLTQQSKGRRSSMSLVTLDQTIRIQEVGKSVKDMSITFWRKVLRKLL